MAYRLRNLSGNMFSNRFSTFFSTSNKQIYASVDSKHQRTTHYVQAATSAPDVHRVLLSTAKDDFSATAALDVLHIECATNADLSSHQSYRRPPHTTFALRKSTCATGALRATLPEPPNGGSPIACCLEPANRGSPIACRKTR